MAERECRLGVDTREDCFIIGQGAVDCRQPGPQVFRLEIERSGRLARVLGQGTAGEQHHQTNDR
jgi:hypothetical protein